MNEHQIIMTAINNLFLFELIKESHALGLLDDKTYREFIIKTSDICTKGTSDKEKEEGETK